LAFLDAELRPDQRLLVERHLGGCWQCRSRLDEIERQAQATAKSYADEGPFGLERVIAAKRRFQAWAREYERQQQCEPRMGHLLRPRPHFVFGGAAIAAVAMIAAFLWFSRPGNPPVAELITAARQAEAETLEGGSFLGQEFRLEVARSGKINSVSRGRLSIYADTETGRFAALWHGSGGDLKQAVWRPSRTEEYLYEPAPSPRAVRIEPSARKTVTFADLANSGARIEAFETVFMDWIRSHRWRPVSLMANVLVFAGQRGVVLSVERGLSRERERILRLRARRKTETTSAELVVELDAESLRPRLQSLRLVSGSETLELRLIPERAELMPAAFVKPSLFRPDVPLAPAPERRRSRPRPVARPPAPSAPPTVAMAAPTASELDMTEVQIRFALHRARACLGEPIEVRRQPDGIRVQGVVNSTRRKETLEAALSAIGAPDFVTVDIRTLEDVAAGSIVPEGRSAQRQSLKVAPGRTPMEAALERYFREAAAGDETAPSVNMRVLQLTNEVVELSAALRDEAWALRRLATQYPPERTARLLSPARALLQEMLSDHTARLRVMGETLRDKLSPVFSFLGVAPAMPELRAAGPVPWQVAADSIHREIVDFHRRVMVLFAGDRPAGGVADAGVARQEDSAAHLLGTLLALSSGLSELETQIVEDFFIGSRLAAGQSAPENSKLQGRNPRGLQESKNQ